MALTTVTGSMITPSTTLSGDVTVTGTMVMGSSFMRNRIINGDMRIDQRNAGASVTPTVDPTYTLDRWYLTASQASKLSVQQNAASVTPAVGFTNYLGATSLSAYSVVASDYFALAQTIEGYNIADLGWGTANAKTVTLSFQVYSSLTGTFGGALRGANANRSYPFSYTISTANTWTTVSITIAGDTSGTWLTTNGAGVIVRFGLGAGSTWSSTAGAWATGNYFSVTGATSVVGTNGATFYITGVQLEIGTSATPFERRLYNQELANCQRYYNRWSGANFSYGGLSQAVGTGSNNPVARRFSWANPVDFRSQPTLGSGGTIQIYTASLSNLVFAGFHGNTSNKNIISFDANSTSASTVNQSVMLIIDSASAANYIDASAEL